MIVEVYLFNKKLGVIEWNQERGASIFQYSEDTLSSSIEPSPVIMPREARVYETTRDHINFNNLPYLLSDSMPDDFGNVMMKEWLKQKELAYDNINPVDRLTYVGKRGMGALEYEPINHNETNSHSINISELLEVAKKVLESKENITYENLDKDNLVEILRIGTSVGGARAKALIAIKFGEGDEIKEIRPGDVIQPEGFSYWLLKFDGANKMSLGETEGKGKIEYAYYKLALEAGIEMSESKIYEENGRFHFLTKRFDRNSQGEKIHMQTWGAMLGIDFKTPKVSSYETLFRLMRRLQIPYYQFEQQYRRALFNVIAKNHDDHVKNFSFLMDNEGKWQISPAYDLTFQYSPGGTWTNDHQSSINGKFNDFERNDLLEFGKSFGVKKVDQILDEVIEAVNKWPVIAKEIDIPKKEIDYISKNLRVKSLKN